MRTMTTTKRWRMMLSLMTWKSKTTSLTNLTLMIPTNSSSSTKANRLRQPHAFSAEHEAVSQQLRRQQCRQQWQRQLRQLLVPMTMALHQQRRDDEQMADDSNHL
jgi:hypothetical protein